MADYTPIEIEVKIPVEDFNRTYRRLEEEGFVYTRTRKEEDVYFNSLYYDLKERDKALRIRRTIDLETKRRWAEINCKGPKLDTVSMSRKELEISIEDPDGMEAILNEIGFLKVEHTVEKLRYYFTRDHVTAALDRVEGLGDFLELEIVEQGEAMREKCLDEIEKLMQTLGYEMRDTVRRSYLSMLVER